MALVGGEYMRARDGHIWMGNLFEMATQGFGGCAELPFGKHARETWLEWPRSDGEDGWNVHTGMEDGCVQTLFIVLQRALWGIPPQKPKPWDLARIWDGFECFPSPVVCSAARSLGEALPRSPYGSRSLEYESTAQPQLRVPAV